uniref:Uncharacterized protein n=1 Tax=Desulfovibrio sp. U5L TaxID=596152 RepID=I2Q027_9BACT
MLIECMVEREGPSVATICGFTYTFKEQPDGAKVCDVNNGGHRERMLSMPAFYRVYEPAAGVEPDINQEPGAPIIPEIPDFEDMDVNAVRIWARTELGIKVKGSLPLRQTIEAVNRELRRKGWIA